MDIQANNGPGGEPSRISAISLPLPVLAYAWSITNSCPQGCRLSDGTLRFHFVEDLNLLATMEPQPFTNLEQLLERIEAAAGGRERVSLDAILGEVGRSSFGPLILIAGLITVSPVIGDTPGVPTAMSVFVFLIAGQLLVGREYIWLPKWLLERSVARETLCKGLQWMRRPFRFVDRFLRPRLTVLTGRAGSYAIASVCMLIAAVLPITELILLTANGLGAALTALGLALVANDGLMALLAFALVGITFGLALLAIR